MSKINHTFMQMWHFLDMREKSQCGPYQPSQTHSTHWLGCVYCEISKSMWVFKPQKYIHDLRSKITQPLTQHKTRTKISLGPR